MKTSHTKVLMDAMERESKKFKNPYNTGYWMNVEEGVLLRDLVRESGSRVYIESGTCHGYSVCWATSVLKDTNKVPWIFTFDIEDKPKLFLDDNYPELQELAPLITYRTMPFHEGIKYVPETPLDMENKFFFIDGDHTTSGIETDWEAISPYLLPNDTVVIHDTCGEKPVRRFFARLKARLEAKGKLKYYHNYETARGMGVVKIR